MNEEERGTRGLGLLLAGGFMLLAGVAVVAFGLSMAGSHGELPPDGPEVLEGVVAQGRVTPVASTDPVLYGFVQVSGAKRTGIQKRISTAYEGPVGSPRITLETDAGTRALRLPPRSPETWKWCPVTHADRDNLDGTGLAALVGSKRLAYDRLTISVWAVRAGDHLMAEVAEDGAVDRVWCGSRDEVIANERSLAQYGGRATATLGGLLALAGAIALGLRFVLRNRENEANNTA